MANFTTELRSICETVSGLSESKGYNSVNEIIANSREKIFNFSYPIFDENYRSVLETKIIKHYYTREICAETYGRWKLFLDMRMNEIMPYYNKLYESELLQFNPLWDVDYTKVGNNEGTQTKNESGSHTNTENGTTTNTSKDERTGVISDNGTTVNTVTHTGTVGDSGETHEALTKTGTVRDNEINGNTRNTTGTVKEETDDTLTKTNNLTATSTDGGKDSTSDSKNDKLDRWDYYSDTPQGSINGLNGIKSTDSTPPYEEDLYYLTNVRHIKEDTSGSTTDSETTYGKTNQTKNTGTVTDVGDKDVLTTHNTSVADAGSKDNTTTYNTQDQTIGTDTNTRTYNTTDQTNGTNVNARNITDENKGTRNGTTTNTSNGSTSNTFNGSTTDEYLEHITGKMAGKSYAELLKEFRDTFLNIDMLIIRNLSDLFFSLYE